MNKLKPDIILYKSTFMFMQNYIAISFGKDNVGGKASLPQRSGQLDDFGGSVDPV